MLFEPAPSGDFGSPTAGVTSIYASSYDTVNFGDMGDTPWWFEIIAAGQSGGTLIIPGPSSWMDGTGSMVSGITNWHYDIMATSLLDMWNQLTISNGNKEQFNLKVSENYRKSP